MVEGEDFLNGLFDLRDCFVPRNDCVDGLLYSLPFGKFMVVTIRQAYERVAVR